MIPLLFMLQFGNHGAGMNMFLEIFHKNYVELGQSLHTLIYWLLWECTLRGMSDFPLELNVVTH